MRATLIRGKFRPSPKSVVPEKRPFDVDAAQQLAQIVVRAAKAGRTVAAPGAYIAASAAAHGFAVATRNAKHFEHTGVAIINPWN